MFRRKLVEKAVNGVYLGKWKPVVPVKVAQLDFSG